MGTKGSKSSKPEVNEDWPISVLPPHILAKIIAYVPVVEWCDLELFEAFRDAISIARRQLRAVSLDRKYFANARTRSSVNNCATIFHTLADRSPFLTSLSAIDIRQISAKLTWDVVRSLAQFQHLESISLGDALLNDLDRGIPLKAVVEFLESTRSRSSLKEVHLFNVLQPMTNRGAILEQFASSFVNGREIQSPLKLEKFTFTSPYKTICIRLDILDKSRMTDVRLGKASIEPGQLANLIERASKLRGIEFSFLPCYDDCNGRRLEANKKLLVALSCHENLTTIKFASLRYKRNCCSCVDFGCEFIVMLKTIGRRGKLRKLALERFFEPSSNMDMGEISATINAHIPYLQSIKLFIPDGMSDASVCNIVTLAHLEEIHFTNTGKRVMPNAIALIAQLPQLKRITLDGFTGDSAKTLGYLAQSKSLSKLRIRKDNFDNAEYDS